jgi:RNA polymerase sigma factor (sigma-70 family)
MEERPVGVYSFSSIEERGYGKQSMTTSLSKSPDAFPPPKAKRSGEQNTERDPAWNENITQEQYTYYYNMAWQIAYLMLKSPQLADTIANKVMEELWSREHPPSTTEIESHIRTLARFRSIDQWRTKGYKLRQTWRSLTQRNGDGEEYEALPELQCGLSAEEEFYSEMESERFVQDLAQAILHLNELQRVCFVLCIMEKMKVAEVATHLQRSPERLIHLKLSSRGIAAVLEPSRCIISSHRQ